MVSSFSETNRSKLYAIIAVTMIVFGAVVACYSISRYLEDESQTNNPTSIRVSQWAGYMVASDLKNRQPVVSSISGSWIVPVVKSSENDTFSAAWVGIGGYGDKTLIQTGTQQQCTNGKVSYLAWYELFPDYLVLIPSMHIRPSDRIEAFINLIDENARTWSIEITDAARGQRFQRILVYNSSRLSAEWIVERPTVNGTISTLADFGNVIFSECYATVENNTGTINNFPFTQFVMYNQDVKLVTVSPLNSNGSSFTVNYLGSQGVFFGLGFDNPQFHASPLELRAATFFYLAQGKTTIQKFSRLVRVKH